MHHTYLSLGIGVKLSFLEFCYLCGFICVCIWQHMPLYSEVFRITEERIERHQRIVLFLFYLFFSFSLPPQ